MTTWLNVANNAQSAIVSAITAVATSLTLVTGEGAKFPATSFNISIDDEIILCTSRSGDVLTVTRAQESTTAAAHAAGAAVSLNVTAAIVTQLQVVVNAIGQTTIRAEPLAEQSIPTGATWPVLLNNEITDIGAEFDSSYKSGTATSTSASHLVDTAATFTAADVGATVWNTTDNTYATITVRNSATDVTLSADIMTSGKAYKSYWSRFVCAAAGTYLFTAGMRYPNTSIIADKGYYIIVLKNGTTQTALSSGHASFVGSLVLAVSVILALVPGDYIQLAAYHAAGSAVTISTGNLTQTNLNIFRLI